jgi:hypothetical protein
MCLCVLACVDVLVCVRVGPTAGALFSPPAHIESSGGRYQYG